MSKSKDFLVGKLKELFNSFDGIRIRYEFDEQMDLHLIEVLPLTTFEDDNDFILQEIQIQDEFEAQFGENEEVLFISADSLNKIEHSEFSLGYNEMGIVEVPVLVNHNFHVNQEQFDYTEKNNNSYLLAA